MITLQQKMDRAFASEDIRGQYYLYDNLKREELVYKALQEFIEQIKELGRIDAVAVGGQTFYWIKMQSVLDLVGENK